MKNYLSAIIITFFCSVCFVDCAVYLTRATNKWLEYELPPSKIVKKGMEIRGLHPNTLVEKKEVIFMLILTEV
jgi:hypothetical protein